MDHEDLMFSLEVVVEKFASDMPPYALHLVQHLAAGFWKIVVRV